MEEVTTISSRNNEGWWAVAYDLHIHYGYETMLLLYDRFISEFHVCVERIAKAEMVGKRHSVVWQRLLFFNAKPLSKMAALKEECGVVAIGCTVKAFDGIQLYLTMMNQTSVITIQVPDHQYSEKVQEQMNSVAHFFQAALFLYERE